MVYIETQIFFFDLLAKKNNYRIYHYETYEFSKDNYYNGSKSIFIALVKNPEDFRMDDFELVGYKSQGRIKAKMVV